MGELGFDLGSILWQLVAFGLLLFVLYKFMYRPTLDMLDARAARVQEGVARAEEARLQSEAAQREYDRSLDEARRLSQELMADATRAAERARQEIQDQARRDAAQMVEEARQQIQTERRQALAAVRDDIVDLSIEATRRVLQGGIDEETQRKLIGRFLQEEHGEGADAR